MTGFTGYPYSTRLRVPLEEDFYEIKRFNRHLFVSTISLSLPPGSHPPLVSPTAPSCAFLRSTFYVSYPHSIWALWLLFSAQPFSGHPLVLNSTTPPTVNYFALSPSRVDHPSDSVPALAHLLFSLSPSPLPSPALSNL